MQRKKRKFLIFKIAKNYREIIIIWDNSSVFCFIMTDDIAVFIRMRYGQGA
jgi:hypothetical protein